jgi:F420-dependent oxidoreductase-like protein
MGAPLRFGVVVAPSGATVDDVAAQLQQIEALGFDSAWMPGIPNGPDILTLLAVAGRSTSRLELGSAIVPVFPRHPAALAVQALTVDDALGGRFTLGVGLSHRKVVEGHLGLSYDQPVAYMRDYLAILRPLLAAHAADHQGERLRTRLRLDVASAAEAPPVMLAALGPRMLALAGEVADGVMTWMTGAATLENHIVPAVVAAARDADRPAPRVLASLPVLLTNDRAAGVERANDEFAVYGRLPAYRAVLARERAMSAMAAPSRPDGRDVRSGPEVDEEAMAARPNPDGREAGSGREAGRRREVNDGELTPGEVALVGDERALTAAIARLRDAGVTDLQATTFGDAAAVDRTLEFLASRPSG